MMEWKEVSFVLIALLIGLGIGYAFSVVVYQRDYSEQLDSIKTQLENMQTQLSQVSTTLNMLPHPKPTYSVVSMARNFSWTNPNTSPSFQDINCSGFGHIFVYVTIDRMNPATGSTTSLRLAKVVWHLYPRTSGQEWTWSGEDVSPETLNVTAYPYDSFNGSTTRSLGGAQFTTKGQYADFDFAFNSTARSGWILFTCSVYLRNE